MGGVDRALARLSLASLTKFLSHLCQFQINRISNFFSLRSDIIALVTVSQTFTVQLISETSYSV